MNRELDVYHSALSLELGSQPTDAPEEALH